MEARGAINQYTPHARGIMTPNPNGPGVILRRGDPPAGEPVFTINLAAGTTPFIRAFHDVECASQCYRLSAPRSVSVAFANFRPTRAEFDTLNGYVQDHVLNGGLLCLPLAEAVAKQLPDDPVQTDWDYERFQEWCQSYYGRRRPPLESPHVPNPANP